MTTLPPAGVKQFPEDSLEKQVYALVEKFSGNIPVQNDRNRLAYSMCKYVQGEGDSPEVLVRSTKIKIEGIGREELAEKLSEGLKDIKK